MKAKCFVCSVTMCECESRLCDDCSELENHVCDSCLADARLGRMVRGMPKFVRIVNRGAMWIVGDESKKKILGHGYTPEAALKAAGVKEVEG